MHVKLYVGLLLTAALPCGFTTPPSAHARDSPWLATSGPLKLHHCNWPVGTKVEAHSLPATAGVNNGTRGKVIKCHGENVAVKFPQGEQRVKLANLKLADGGAGVIIDISGHLHGRVGRDANGKHAWKKNKLKLGAAGMSIEEKRKAYKGYCFNSHVSASVSLDRKLTNYQPEQCLDSLASTQLPNASVVIVFVDEDLSVLLRSVHSILNRSPPHLLVGIELVDDGSDPQRSPWLFQELESYVALLPKTRLWRMGRRSGLMAARVFGARQAEGHVLIFLDSHIECAEGWLEPLVARIAEDRRSAPMPVIGSIDADTFEPRISGLGMGILGFHWRLGQKHLHHRGRHCQLLGGCPSPIMPGGLFAIEKVWFLDELGGYDEEMQLYGGEEMEISFKIWQCGGRVELVPCSHVYHVFRDNTYWKGQVYKVPSEVIYRNKLRTADVWMDEFAALVHLSMSPLPDGNNVGSLVAARAVRDRLKCKSFAWYLREVYPDLKVPNLTDSTVGSLQSIPSASLSWQYGGVPFCVDTLGDGRRGKPLGIFGCHGQHGAQALLHTADGMLRLGTEDYEGCAVPGAADEVLIGSCSLSGTWHHHKSGKFKYRGSDESGVARCLTAEIGLEGQEPRLALKTCRRGDSSQQWSWTPPRGWTPGEQAPLPDVKKLDGTSTSRTSKRRRKKKTRGDEL